VFVKELHCRICFYRAKIEACREKSHIASLGPFNRRPSRKTVLSEFGNSTRHLSRRIIGSLTGTPRVRSDSDPIFIAEKR
jgi:hypothetical protein